MEIRELQREEIPAFANAFTVPLGLEHSQAWAERFAAYGEVNRYRLGWDEGRVVATLGAHSLPMTVPGGRVSTAGTCTITVMPTHRRRGILRQLMSEHLIDLRKRGDVLSALWASEGDIYGRFGYGMATERAHWRIPAAHAQLRLPPERPTGMRWLDADEAAQQLPPLYERIAQQRVGFVGRRPLWWEYRVFADPVGASGVHPQRRVLYAPEGEPQGYALYRTRRVDPAHGQQVMVQEVVAATPEAERALWQFLFSLDLIDSVDIANLSVESPLRWWLRDLGKVDRRVHDALWLRIVEVEQALQARRYAAEGQLVLEVRDAFCPWNEGSYRLVVGDHGNVTCLRTDERPDVSCSIESLGAVYLAGGRWSDHWRAGLVTGSVEAIQRADCLFAWHQVPWCPDKF
jgi:predicted acetyltransferase